MLRGLLRIAGFEGLLPVPARRVGRLILAEESVAETGRAGQTAGTRGCRRQIRNPIWIGRSPG